MWDLIEGVKKKFHHLCIRNIEMPPSNFVWLYLRLNFESIEQICHDNHGQLTMFGGVPPGAPLHPSLAKIMHHVLTLGMENYFFMGALLFITPHGPWTMDHMTFHNSVQKGILFWVGQFSAND